MSSPLYLKQMEIGPMQNFVYLIGDRNKREALVVDPAWDVTSILEAAAQDDLKIKGALITHTHFDHVNGLGELLAKTDGTVYIHKKEAEFLKEARGNIKKVEGGDKIKVGDVEITFLHTPGHTPGSQCFLVEHHLVSGDTLFIGACGRCDLPGGNAEEMYRSLTRLSELERSTILHPGHNYADEVTSTIAQERASNPYLQFKSVKEFLQLRMGY